MELSRVSMKMLLARLDDYQLGDVVKLTLMRKGKKRALPVTLQTACEFQSHGIAILWKSWLKSERSGKCDVPCGRSGQGTQ